MKDEIKIKCCQCGWVHTHRERKVIANAICKGMGHSVCPHCYGLTTRPVKE